MREVINNLKILVSAINKGDGVGLAQLRHETSLFSDVFTVEENSREWYEVDTMIWKMRHVVGGRAWVRVGGHDNVRLRCLNKGGAGLECRTGGHSHNCGVEMCWKGNLYSIWKVHRGGGVQNPNSFFENNAECVKTFGKNSKKKWVRNIHAKNSEVL